MPEVCIWDEAQVNYVSSQCKNFPIRQEADNEADATKTERVPQKRAFTLPPGSALAWFKCSLTALQRPAFHTLRMDFFVALLATAFPYWILVLEVKPFLACCFQECVWCVCQCATREGFILPPLNGMAVIQQAWVHV